MKKAIVCLIVLFSADNLFALENLTYLSDQRSIYTEISTSRFPGEQFYDASGTPLARQYSESIGPSSSLADFDENSACYAEWYFKWLDSDLYIADKAGSSASQSSTLGATRIVGTGMAWSGPAWWARSYAESVLETTFVIHEPQYYTLWVGLGHGPGSTPALFSLSSLHHGVLHGFSSLDGDGGYWAGSFSGVLPPDIYTMTAYARNYGDEGDLTAWSLDFAVPDAANCGVLLAIALTGLFLGERVIRRRSAAVCNRRSGVH